MTPNRRRSPTGWCTCATAASAPRPPPTAVTARRSWSAAGAGDLGWELPDRPRGAVVAEVRELGKTYGAAQVFDGLSARFEAGKLAVVSGPSGSGKTTLLHLLAGIDLPTAGEAIVLGKRISALDLAGRAELRRESIAVVTQGAR